MINLIYGFFPSAYETVGCYKDAADRAISSLEGLDPILDAPFMGRQKAIVKCATVAMAAGYSIFAVQNGGHCFSNATAPQTFDKYGKSSDCQAGGEGGWWANQVYYIKGKIFYSNSREILEQDKRRLKMFRFWHGIINDLLYICDDEKLQICFVQTYPIKKYVL